MASAPGRSGETKLEVDRRRIMRRITKLESDLKDLHRNRQLQRKSRSRSGLAAVTIVGYTNAGKSTLLNHLTDAGVLVEDRLFATLDPTTRRLSLPGGEPVLITDTVGFVRNLPHGLVEAFKSTLEVVAAADLLVHVVDATAPDPEGRSPRSAPCSPRSAPTGAGAAGVQQVRLAPDVAKRLVERHEGSVACQRVTGEGIDDLLHGLGDRLRALSQGRRAAHPVRPRRPARRRPSRGRGARRRTRRRRRAGAGPARRRVGRPALRVRRRRTCLDSDDGPR